MKRSLGAVLPVFLLVLNTPAAFAQQLQATVFPVAITSHTSRLELSGPSQEEATRPEDAMSMSGMFLGLVAMMAGAAVASGLSQDECQESEDEGCLSRRAFTGALIGGTAAVPIGVHLANQNRKRLVMSMAVSTATAAALYFAFRSIPGEPVHFAPFLAAPVQVITSIKIETGK